MLILVIFLFMLLVFKPWKWEKPQATEDGALKKGSEEIGKDGKACRRLRAQRTYGFFICYNNLMKSFKDRVLDVVRKIPEGKVLTYKEVAKKAGNEKAARVVGNFMKGNYDKTVPCHRVIRSDGKIGDYNRGGSKAKRALLKKEGAVR